jgi:hypothetical protein
MAKTVQLGDQPDAVSARCFAKPLSFGPADELFRTQFRVRLEIETVADLDHQHIHAQLCQLRQLLHQRIYLSIAVQAEVNSAPGRVCAPPRVQPG